MALIESACGANAERDRRMLNGTASLRASAATWPLTARAAWQARERGGHGGDESAASSGVSDAFRVDEILMDGEPRVLIHGGISPESLPRLRTVIDGLLLLRPSSVTVEVPTTGDRELLWFLGHGRYSAVRVCTPLDDAPVGVNG